MANPPVTAGQHQPTVHGATKHDHGSHTDYAHGGYAHQFDSAEQQYATTTFGMWVFLITEVMTFGGLFLAYIVYRTVYPDVWSEASTHQNVIAGTVNTAVLIFSSLTMALAVRSAQVGNRRGTSIFLLITIACAVIFLIIKAIEYTEHFGEHLFPGASFAVHEFAGLGGMAGQHAQIFFLLYFLMTGLHAFHIIIGIIILGLMFYGNQFQKKFSSKYFSPIEATGLYWHFVDLVWIFLFPLLYLIGGLNSHGI